MGIEIEVAGSCGCEKCRRIDDLRAEAVAFFSERCAALGPVLGMPAAKSAVMAAITLTLGDAITSYVEPYRWLEDADMAAQHLKAAIRALEVEPVTIQ